MGIESRLPEYEGEGGRLLLNLRLLADKRVGETDFQLPHRYVGGLINE